MRPHPRPGLAYISNATYDFIHMQKNYAPPLYQAAHWFAMPKMFQTDDGSNPAHIPCPTWPSNHRPSTHCCCCSALPNWQTFPNAEVRVFRLVCVFAIVFGNIICSYLRFRVNCVNICARKWIGDGWVYQQRSWRWQSRWHSHHHLRTGWPCCSSLPRAIIFNPHPQFPSYPPLWNLDSHSLAHLPFDFRPQSTCSLLHFIEWLLGNSTIWQRIYFPITSRETTAQPRIHSHT